MKELVLPNLRSWILLLSAGALLGWLAVLATLFGFRALHFLS
jgi:hypothetical protein